MRAVTTPVITSTYLAFQDDGQSMKKDAKTRSRKKPTAQPPDPLEIARKFRPAKSTSKLKPKKQLYKSTKSDERTVGIEGSKLNDIKSVRLHKLKEAAQALPGKQLAREYLRLQKVSSLQAELFSEVRSQLSSGGRTMTPGARLLLNKRVRDAAVYLKAKGSQADVEKAKVLLQIFAQSFPIVSTPISLSMMQRNMKRWLPCPPFCKER
jgi:hypothetical protein